VAFASYHILFFAFRSETNPFRDGVFPSFLFPFFLSSFFPLIMKPNYADLKSDHHNSRERQNYVTEMFDALAPSYDRFNRFVSFSRDENWRKGAIALLESRSAGAILDLAAGTGDLSLSASAAGASRVHVFDISHNMLLHAKTKLTGSVTGSGASKFHFERGSAHLLPYKDNTFSGVVSGFAMRNVFHFLDEVLREIHRVLEPGGRFAILELSRPLNPVLRFGFKIHMRTIMPIIGKLTAGRFRPFRYLGQTTMTFLSPPEFKERLELAGFVSVSWKSYLFGGIAIHFGEKTK
jgi:demethylmenaquinone methyltransferase/2-methoxy-6-polyprenyl-1,4-benzoquinol methylase